ncbi:hypothetical protein P7C73_g6859, partial [Tremellales sp. Uapishka_1]
MSSPSSEGDPYPLPSPTESQMQQPSVHFGDAQLAGGMPPPDASSSSSSSSSSTKSLSSASLTPTPSVLATLPEIAPSGYRPYEQDSGHPTGRRKNMGGGRLFWIRRQATAPFQIRAYKEDGTMTPRGPAPYPTTRVKEKPVKEWKGRQKFSRTFRDHYIFGNQDGVHPNVGMHPLLPHADDPRNALLKDISFYDPESLPIDLHPHNAKALGLVPVCPYWRYWGKRKLGKKSVMNLIRAPNKSSRPQKGGANKNAPARYMLPYRYTWRGIKGGRLAIRCPEAERVTRQTLISNWFYKKGMPGAFLRTCWYHQGKTSERCGLLGWYIPCMQPAPPGEPAPLGPRAEWHPTKAQREPSNEKNLTTKGDKFLAAVNENYKGAGLPLPVESLVGGGDNDNVDAEEEEEDEEEEGDQAQCFRVVGV